ncbi:hypothetical protein Hanom_Chr03g00253061 [Helianthus anomalus]
MGTEVLHPQDCFINVSLVIGTKIATNNNQKPPEKMGSASRRDLNMKLHCVNDDDSYAGSAFFRSPSPKSLPFPSFFSKKHDSRDMVADREATKHLCRLLRLG